MKLAIISDIHGNLTALNAVLEDIARRDCVKILCCGDIVGYGPHPGECLEIIRSRNIPCVRGNHDDLMINSERLAVLRREVKTSVLWTREQLSAQDRQWLGALPFRRQYAGIELIHASHVFHPPWQYVTDLRTVSGNFLFQKAAISFHGHTHLPLLGLHRRGARPKLLMLRDLQIPPNHKCLVNAGSVGQPRDRNPDAAYITFDSHNREINLHRVPYDIRQTADDIRKADLPDRLASRLFEGR